jgi:hypothetical protein
MHNHPSRVLYRRLVQLLEPDYGRHDAERAREILLHACEATIVRLANEREHFVATERFLFSSIRALYPTDTQTRVRRIIEDHFAAPSTGVEREEVAV